MCATGGFGGTAVLRFMVYLDGRPLSTSCASICTMDSSLGQEDLAIMYYWVVSEIFSHIWQFLLSLSELT